MEKEPIGLPIILSRDAQKAQELLYDSDTLGVVRGGNRYLFRYIDHASDNPNAAIRGTQAVVIALHVAALRQDTRLPVVTSETVDKFYNNPFWDAVEECEVKLEAGQINQDEYLEIINRVAEESEHSPFMGPALDKENPGVTIVLDYAVEEAKKRFSFGDEAIEEMKTCGYLAYGLLRLAAIDHSVQLL